MVDDDDGDGDGEPYHKGHVLGICGGQVAIDAGHVIHHSDSGGRNITDPMFKVIQHSSFLMFCLENDLLG
jgi:hypothetical protein